MRPRESAGELGGVDARRAEEQKFFDTRAVCSMDDVGFDEQIVVDKIRGKSVVSVDAAHATGGQQNDPWTMRRHPFLDLGLVSEIQHLSTWIEQQRARFVP
jgi:hypothetical protein